MMYLTKAQILEANDVQSQDVEVPEWGGSVRLVSLDAKEASAFGSRMVKMDAKGNVEAFVMDNFMAELLARAIVDENNQPIFSQSDVEALGKKNGAVIKRLYTIAAELSGLGEGNKDEAVKNSDGMPSDASHSD
jgi:hypothetical protein